MKKIIYYIASLLLLCLISCEDTTTVYNPNSDTAYKKQQFSTLAGQFDYIWTGLNNSYVFWYADSTNWDAIREHFMPEFQELDRLGKMGADIKDETIDSLITEVVSSLRDRHLTIYMSNPYSDNPSPISTISGLSSLAMRDGSLLLIFGDKYYKDNLFKNYSISFDRMFNYTEGEMEKNAYSCVIEDSIPFLHIGNYYLTDKDFCQKNPEYLAVVSDFFDNIRSLSSQDKLKGIIIDNRFNTGGRLEDEEAFVQTFSSESLEVSRQRSKYGLGKYDYSPWLPFIINPNNEKHINTHNVPIVILQDLYSISAGEIVGHSLSLLPNTYLIGNRTFGALSPEAVGGFDVFHTGSFNSDSIDYYLKNYGVAAGVYTACVCTEVKNKKTGKFEQLEGIGIEPDEYVELDELRLIKKEGDNQLDAALRYIRNKTTK